MDDFVSDSSGKSLRSQFTQRQKTVLRNLVLATALFAFSLLGIYFSIASGLLLVLMCGALLRIILLGDPCWTPYSLDNILTGFVESFMLSALLLAPLAYIAPFLFGKVNFLLMVYVITIILVPLGAYLLPKETPSEGISKEKAAQADMGSSATAWITIILWISLGILDLAYSFHMYYGSFADAFFMFGDLTNSLTIIQSIATGIYPTPNLTFLGSTLSENPITLTLSFGYSAVLMTAMNLQGYGDLFVILIKMIMHSAVVPVVYYAVRSVSARVPAWVMVVSTLGLGVTMDLTPLFRFLGVYDDDLNYTLTNEMYRGVYFPWDTPDGVPADFFAPGLGYESALASFHHLLPLLFFVFIIALLLQMTDWRSGTAIAILIGLVELPFFHIGIGFFPLVSVGIVVVSIMLLRLISRAHIRPRFLVYKALVVLGIVGLFIVRGIVSGLVVITPRFTGTAILDALGAYLGPFLLLGAIGYIALHFLPESPGKWLSIVWLEFTLLSTLLFSMARDSGIGYMPTDYFPLFNLQTSLVLAFALGVSYWSSNRGQALKSLDQFIGPRKWWQNLKDLNQSLRLRAGVLTRHSARAMLLGELAFILSLFLLGGLQTSWFYQYNLGEFNEYFYDSVPKVTPEERSMLAWIHENSQSDAVVLCAPENWELTAIIGRQILYSGYRTANTSDPRYQAYFAMYNSTAMDDVIALFVEYEVRLVVFTPIERDRFSYGYPKFESSSHSSLVYSHGEYAVFAIHWME